ncbi:MAG TPA: DNA adenine methylase [Polyangiaceae bacterium]|nr:DNA adenine methylase [Polyangiaceae bacterium]
MALSGETPPRPRAERRRAAAPAPPARVPHPLPYQGSKRRLAAAILAEAGPGPYAALYEPFCGSAALTLAAAARGLAPRFVLGDSLEPLVALWRAILESPARVASAYGALWRAQHGDPAHYERVRERFNRARDPAALLYLLARCAKAAVRFNRGGDFNQAPDRRRHGMRPERLAAEVAGAARLLAGRARLACADYEATIAAAGPADLVYLDPPFQGTSEGRDRRYAAGLERARLVASLAGLNARGVPFLLSYDGRSGARAYGEPLPRSLGLRLVRLDAGVSSQATLLGRRERTLESLYLSPALLARRRR